MARSICMARISVLCLLVLLLSNWPCLSSAPANIMCLIPINTATVHTAGVDALLNIPSDCDSVLVQSVRNPVIEFLACLFPEYIFVSLMAAESHGTMYRKTKASLQFLKYMQEGERVTQVPVVDPVVDRSQASRPTVHDLKEFRLSVQARVEQLAERLERSPSEHLPFRKRVIQESNCAPKCSVALRVWRFFPFQKAESVYQWPGNILVRTAARILNVCKCSLVDTQNVTCNSNSLHPIGELPNMLVTVTDRLVVATYRSVQAVNSGGESILSELCSESLLKKDNLNGGLHEPSPLYESGLLYKSGTASLHALCTSPDGCFRVNSALRKRFDFYFHIDDDTYVIEGNLRSYSEQVLTKSLSDGRKMSESQTNIGSPSSVLGPGIMSGRLAYGLAGVFFYVGGAGYLMSASALSTIVNEMDVTEDYAIRKKLISSTCNNLNSSKSSTGGNQGEPADSTALNSVSVDSLSVLGVLDLQYAEDFGVAYHARRSCPVEMKHVIEKKAGYYSEIWLEERESTASSETKCVSFMTGLSQSGAGQLFNKASIFSAVQPSPAAMYKNIFDAFLQPTAGVGEAITFHHTTPRMRDTFNALRNLNLE